MESDEWSNRRELIAELERLEREEAQLSGMRRRLHNQIDLGFANESTFEREREVSDKRLELHARMDALREQLARSLANQGAPAASRNPSATH